MRNKPRLYIRKFINKPGHHTIASVLASVGKGGNVQFILSDCDRTVKLEFTTYTAPARKNSIYKVQTLIEVLTEFKRALEEEFEANPTRNDDDY